MSSLTVSPPASVRTHPSSLRPNVYLFLCLFSRCCLLYARVIHTSIYRYDLPPTAASATTTVTITTQAARESGERAAEVSIRRFLMKEMSTTKQCPTCDNAITKNGGCNKMTCPTCNCFFCWHCGVEVEGYDHFNSNGDSPCAGKLFDPADIEEWARGMGPGEMDGHHRHGPGGGGDGRGGGNVGVRRSYSACTGCGQLNERINNNNHLRCRFCRHTWCHLCRADLRGKGAAAIHFGPSKCHQHTRAGAEHPPPGHGGERRW